MEIPQVIKTYVETWTTHDLKTCIGLFTPDGTYIDPTIPEPALPRNLKQQWEGLFAGLPDLRFETVGLDAISENLWVWRWTGHGTNTGSFMGAPPTGRKVTLPGCEFVEIRDGRIHSVVGYFDQLTMLAQLGLAPS